MIKVRILDTCPHCNGKAYLPAGEDVDYKATPTRHIPCPHCEGTGMAGRWVDLTEFALLLDQAKCPHEHLADWRLPLSLAECVGTTTARGMLLTTARDTHLILPINKGRFSNPERRPFLFLTLWKVRQRTSSGHQFQICTIWQPQQPGPCATLNPSGYECLLSLESGSGVDVLHKAQAAITRLESGCIPLNKQSLISAKDSQLSGLRLTSVPSSNVPMREWKQAHKTPQAGGMALGAREKVVTGISRFEGA